MILSKLWRNLNSADADVPGSKNIIGVKSHMVDEWVINAWWDGEGK